MVPGQNYKEDYSSIRILLVIILCVIFFGFSFFYYSHYKQSNYNFYQPYQQENERLKVDSINIAIELENERSKFCSAKKQSQLGYLEMRYISKIINILTNKEKLLDSIGIENTNSYIKIHQLKDYSKENDTLFTIFRIIDSIQTKQFVKLKCKHFGWGKFGDKSATNENDNIFVKLNDQEKIVREELSKSRSNEFQYNERIEYLTEELKYVKKGSLDVIDFIIFSGNIHTSLGFNGIIPASSKMRLWCLIHKIIVIVLYYFIYTRFKSKNPN